MYETQHLPIYIHLQAMACKWGWLKYESGLSNDKNKPSSNISRAASYLLSSCWSLWSNRTLTSQVYGCTMLPPYTYQKFLAAEVGPLEELSRMLKDCVIRWGRICFVVTRITVHPKIYHVRPNISLHTKNKIWILMSLFYILYGIDVGLSTRRFQSSVWFLLGCIDGGATMTIVLHICHI